jgi:predicted RNA binding protein YcfA (HicA-like mRNA interferase family)
VPALAAFHRAEEEEVVAVVQDGIALRLLATGLARLSYAGCSHAEGAGRDRLVEGDGWVLARTRGSHRVYTHPTRPGVAVVAGSPSKDLPAGTWNSILRQAGLK